MLIKKITPMKKIISILILSIVLVSCGKKPVDFTKLQDRNGMFFLINADKPFTGRVIHKINDTLIFQGAFKDGIRSGEWTFYYPNRQIMTSGMFVDGLKDGQWPVWQENGEIDYYEMYRLGTLIAGGPSEAQLAAKEKEEKEEEEEEEEKEEVEEKKPEITFVDWERLRGGSRKTLNGVPYTGGVIKYYRNPRTRELVGYFNNGYRSGKWTFYHRNGSVRDVRYY